jgi:hypothetical protein
MNEILFGVLALSTAARNIGRRGALAAIHGGGATATKAPDHPGVAPRVEQPTPAPAPRTSDRIGATETNTGPAL